MRGFLVTDSGAFPVSRDDLALAPPDAEWLRHGDTLWVKIAGETHALRWQSEVDHFAEEAGGAGDHLARAPMPGSVIAIHVAAGEQVSEGDPLLLIESMKLEMAIRAPCAGIVAEVHVAPGGTFDRDALLVTLEPAL